MTAHAPDGGWTAERLPTTRRPGQRPWLRPGEDTPADGENLAAIAARCGSERQQIAAWCAEAGLTVRDDRCDPFALINWLSRPEQRGRLPALDRRWRSWRATYAAWLGGCSGAVWRLRWRRRHRLLVGAVGAWRRWLPAPLQGDPWQECHVMHWDICPHEQGGDPNQSPWARWDGQGPPAPLTGIAELTLFPRRDAVAEGDAAWLAERCQELVDSWSYGYRLHDPLTAGLVDGWGSCLDGAQALVACLQYQGRPSRLVGGLVARDGVANPHFWVETAGAQGTWLSLDPSLAAIARSLGDPDWPSWIRPWIGGHEPRRIALARGPWGHAELPEAQCSLAVGAAAVTDADGAWWNAWYAIDMVCGETDADFTRLATLADGAACARP